MFYKLPALQQQGVQIHLHCFDYGRGRQQELDKYCASIAYYPRKPAWATFASKYPYIVSSRINNELLQHIQTNDYPILMEGIHCSYPLADNAFNHRHCFTRLHNIESDYYKDLASNTRSSLKRIHYRSEAKLLHDYQLEVAPKGKWLSVTTKDAEDFKQRYHCLDINFLPLFLPPWFVTGKEGFGKYCLYQGDLSVSSNTKMAERLIEEVFSHVHLPFLIAGKKPPAELRKLAARHQHINVISDPTEKQMQQLIADAHVNVLPSLSSTGIKLKLLNALYNGRYCLVNKETVDGTGLESLCIVSEIEHIQQEVEDLFKAEFKSEDIERRRYLLNSMFNNEINAERLTNYIWP